MLLFITAVFLVYRISTGVNADSLDTQCERAPSQALTADLRYKLSVAGDPDLFLPGELYTVSLQGVDSGQGPTPFIGFTIWAEIEEPADGDVNAGNYSLGSFQAYDAQTKQREYCKPAVDNATAHPKTEIQVIWSAPLSTADICVRLVARARPAAGHTESVLARKLCAAPPSSTSFARQPPIVEPCCACDEAKYEVTFEGIWSRNTHPRDFPPSSARAHFGDLIGASHTAQHRVWQEGRVASAGLRELADVGATTALEKELKAESDHIRTIIKARGISWQQVEGAGTPSTFAVFRVDARHHLVSFAAKLAPSPDWIMGVSALELCNANCTWRKSITLPLYPYDAGTDGGISYTSSRQPTVPPAPVRALRPDWPRDVRSPFYGTNDEMRPFARLRLTRLRLYEKTCDSSETGGEKTRESGVSGGGSCALRTWGAWGPCSVTCGVGRSSRQRHYVSPVRAIADACRKQLTNYRRCHGPRLNCRTISEYEPDPAESSGPCAVSPWSEWSPCEGCGIRARTRHYLGPRAHKRCHVGFRARTVMSQARPCADGPCVRPPSVPANATNFDWFFVDNRVGDCSVTPWSEWSPCTARCGRGRRLRTRFYLSKDSRVQTLLIRRLTNQWNRRFAQLQLVDLPVENVTSSDPEVEKLTDKHMEQCEFTLTQQEALCDADNDTCPNFNLPKEVCAQPVLVGPCRGYKERWFFDTGRNACEPFGFTGCGGNENNFPTRERCLYVCGNTSDSHFSLSTAVPLDANNNNVSKKNKTSTSKKEENEVLQNDSPLNEDMNCTTGPWLGWGECFGDCHSGIKLNYRLILGFQSGSGKPCPSLVKNHACIPDHCRNLVLINNSTVAVGTVD